MAAEIRSENSAVALEALEDELRSNPTAFEFFQAVLLLERLRRDRDGVGLFVDPSNEAVRFSSQRSISFPPGEIHSLEMNGAAQARMTVNVMGVTGPLGVLPYHYTLLAVERARAKDTAYADFLDLFNHRLISLFYRAWRKNRPILGTETGEDRLRRHLLDLVGMGLEGFTGNLGFEEDSLAFYAGLLAGQRRSAIALEQLLEDVFVVPVQVEQFVGGWYPLPERDQCELGDESGASSRLGLGAVVGDEIWEQQSRVRIRVGPLNRTEFQEFLPTGGAFSRLRALTRFFGNGEHEFELQLVLARDDVQGCVLGDETGTQPLGWSTWIRTEDFAREADDTVLKL